VGGNVHRVGQMISEQENSNFNAGISFNNIHQARSLAVLNEQQEEDEEEKGNNVEVFNGLNH
jgi:hypothetical protein